MQSCKQLKQSRREKGVVDLSIIVDSGEESAAAQLTHDSSQVPSHNNNAILCRQLMALAGLWLVTLSLLLEIIFRFSRNDWLCAVLC